MLPVVRIGVDLHVCPAATGPVPHVGGPIIGPGAPTVLSGAIPTAVRGDICTCVSPPATIVAGSATVLATGKMVARVFDPTAHGGEIVGPGLGRVLVGG